MAGAVALVRAGAVGADGTDGVVGAVVCAVSGAGLRVVNIEPRFQVNRWLSRLANTIPCLGCTGKPLQSLATR